MKAINIKNANTLPAPKEWKELSEVRESRPIGYIETSLQRVVGTGKIGVAQWYGANVDGTWEAIGDVFLVTKISK